MEALALLTGHEPYHARWAIVVYGRLHRAADCGMHSSYARLSDVEARDISGAMQAHQSPPQA